MKMSVAITYLKQQIMENDDDLLRAIELVNEDKQQIMEKDATIVSQGGGGQARE